MKVVKTTQANLQKMASVPKSIRVGGTKDSESRAKQYVY
jgi:hypothetical protein